MVGVLLLEREKITPYAATNDTVVVVAATDESVYLPCEWMIVVEFVYYDGLLLLLLSRKPAIFFSCVCAAVLCFIFVY